MDNWKKVVAGLVALVAGVVYATHGHAAAPAMKGQAPGYYRMMLGDFEVTALVDGTLGLDVKKLLTNVKPTRVDGLLKRAFLTNPVETSVNGFLINTGSKLVLIDAGAGKLFGPTLGNLLTSLKAAGYQPEQVDEVYITHMHGDHVGGLMQGDQRAFPNAIVRADQRDADSDSKTAAAQRRKVYADSAKQGVLLAVAHIAFPGMGHIRSEGSGYVFYPVNYAIPR